MEDVLDVYAETYDPTRPVVCFDERPCQLHDHVLEPLPCSSGKPRRIDSEYARCGTCNLFIMVEPLGGWRNVTITPRRTKQDFAHQMYALVHEHFPSATQIRVVLDNLNTHTPAAFYEAFPPEIAHDLCQKLEFHFTPKHGSWLNMAELELGILVRQCLQRRLPDIPTLQLETTAWADHRNAQHATITWSLTTSQARSRLDHLYPLNSNLVDH